jgi:hypothetical protein
MKYLRRAFEAERQGKSRVSLGFFGETPYIHTEMLDMNKEVISSSTTFFLEWLWVMESSDFELNQEDELF